jgi:preprotein translocase subunit Sss1
MNQSFSRDELIAMAQITVVALAIMGTLAWLAYNFILSGV